MWVHEKKPRTCVRAGELANEYEQVQKQEPAGVELRRKLTGEQNRGSSLGKPTQPGRSSSAMEDSAGRMPQQSRTGLERVKCFGCKNFGHMKKNCPDREAAMYCKDQQKRREAPGQVGGVWRHGLVEGREVQDILLDTGQARMQTT